MPDKSPRKQRLGAARPSVLDNAATGFTHRTRAEQLAAALDTRIRSGELEPGASIGTLKSLQAETGFAYSTVSEAIRLLRDRGVLEIRPGRGGGLFVATSGPVVRMRHTLLSVPDQPATIADAVELRDHLEVLIDVAAARHRTGRDLSDLKVLLSAMESAPTWDEFVHANWSLHERIAQICPNEMARAVYVGTLGHLNATSPRMDDSDADTYWRQRLEIHVDLIDAIASGEEPAVREAVARHNHTV
jgi:GntR family transcriptional repressor for pyruvate dehydrogenase complex